MFAQGDTPIEVVSQIINVLVLRKDVNLVDLPGVIQGQGNIDVIIDIGIPGVDEVVQEESYDTINGVAQQSYVRVRDEVV